MSRSTLLQIRKVLLRGVLIGLVLSLAWNTGVTHAFGRFGDLPGIANCANGQGNVFVPSITPGGSFGMQYGIFCYISVAMQLIILAILYAIGWLFSELLYAAATATQWMINFSIDAATHQTVSTGFEYTLQFANIIFILALVIIAFATVLRWHEYDARKLLPRLVIATLLINFSLLFAGLLLDASNVFTKYFVEQIKTQNIGEAFQPQKFSPGSDTFRDHDGTVKKLEIGAGQHSWEAFFVLFPRTLFAILMTFIAFMAMLAAAMMALVRTVWVILLLVVMPLAWAMWVLPKYEHYWKTWWKNFLNWGVIYLPTVTFFIYLAFITASNNSHSSTPGLSQQLKNDALQREALQGATNDLSIIGLMFADAIRAMIIIGILIGGLKIAQAMGAPIAGTVADLASRGSKKIARVATKGTVLGMGGTVGATIGFGKGLYKAPGAMKASWKQAGKDGGFQTGNALLGGVKSILGGTWRGQATGSKVTESAPRAAVAGAANVLARGALVPVAGEFLTGLAGAASQYARNKKPIEEAGKRFEGLEGKDLERALKGVFLNPLSTLQDKAAALMYADKNHKLDALKGHEVVAADALAAMMPGIKRSKIGAIKNLAAHAMPHDADGSLVRGISGETHQEVLNRASDFHMEAKDIKAFMARYGNQLTQQQINSIAGQSPQHQMALRNHLAGQAGDLLGVDGKAKLSAIEDTLKRIEELNKQRDKDKNNPLVYEQLNEAQESYRKAVSELNRSLENIADSDNAQWKGASAEQKEAVRQLRGLRRAIGNKDEASHGSHSGRNGIGELVDALIGALPGGGKGGSSVKPSSGGGGGDSHGGH